MKLKDLISLNNVDKMREYLNKQGLNTVTDEEITAINDAFEGHGFELFTESMESNKIYRVDLEYDNNMNEEYELKEEYEDYYTENIRTFLDCIIIEMGYLCEEKYQKKMENWQESFKAYNLICSVSDKRLESNLKLEYTVEKTKFNSATKELFVESETFKTAQETNEYVYKLAYSYIEENKDNEVRLQTSNYNFKDTDEIEKFLLEIHEQRRIYLYSNNGYLNIRVDRKDLIGDLPKIYSVSTDKTTYGVYEQSEENFHFISLDEATAKYNEIVDKYKNKYPKDSLEEHDSMYESDTEECKYFELFVDDNFTFKCSLDLVEIN